MVGSVRAGLFADITHPEEPVTITHSAPALPRKLNDATALKAADTPATWEQWDLPASLRRRIPLQLFILHVPMLTFTKPVRHPSGSPDREPEEDSTKRTGYKQMLVEDVEAHK